MSSNKSPRFFEPRTIVAFALTMIVFILWQNHMKTKYPHIYNKKTEQAAVENSEELTVTETDEQEKSQIPSAEKTKTPETALENKELAKKATIEEKIIKYDSKKWSAEISNLGLEFKKVELKDYKERDLKNQIHFEDIFKTTFFGISEAMPFNVTQEGDNIIGVFENENGKIIKTLTFNPDNYSVSSSYEIQGAFPGLSVFIALPINENIKTSFLMPTFERQEYVVLNAEGVERDPVNNADFATRSFNQVKLLSLGSQFFSNAIVDGSTIKPNAVVYSSPSNKTVIARLDYEFSKEFKSFHISQTYFAGPKDDVILKSVDKQMIHLINFGWFKVICEPILVVLKFFYSIAGNYGIAIILLTLLMRMLVFPIAYRGYKSMEKMQRIQPQLKAIREKYKDDSQKANLETMELMKREQVNPVGGCLPMLLQLPIFFAFYRVLSESIVMYQTPFALWIHDLSLKDPYYVLPVLMGATMFMQQKLTPTTLEPLQQRIMLFMPLFFSLLMFSLPSALTLYIFVSTLFGVLQQYVFTKSKAPVPVAVTK